VEREPEEVRPCAWVLMELEYLSSY